MLINNEGERKEKKHSCRHFTTIFTKYKKEGTRQQNIVSIVCNKGQTYYIGRNTVSLFAISSKWFRLDGLSLFILHRRPFRWCARDGPRGSLYVDRSGDRNNKQTTAPFFIFFFLLLFLFFVLSFFLFNLFIFPFFFIIFFSFLHSELVECDKRSKYVA